MKTENNQKVCNIISNIDNKPVKHKMIIDLGKKDCIIPTKEIKEIVENGFNSKLDYASYGKMAVYDKSYKKIKKIMDTFDIQFISSTLVAEDICHAIADKLCDVMVNKPEKFYGPCVNETED